jgi:hypothetical protein
VVSVGRCEQRGVPPVEADAIDMTEVGVAALLTADTDEVDQAVLLVHAQTCVTFPSPAVIWFFSRPDCRS